MSTNTKTILPLNGLSTSLWGDSKKSSPASREGVDEFSSATQTATKSATANPSFESLSNPSNGRRGGALFPSTSTTVPTSTETGTSTGKMSMAFSGTSHSASNDRIGFDNGKSFFGQLRNDPGSLPSQALNVHTDESSTAASDVAAVGVQLGIRQRHGAGDGKSRGGPRRPPSLPPPKTSRLNAVFGNTANQAFLTQAPKDANIDTTSQSTTTRQSVFQSEIPQTHSNSQQNQLIPSLKTQQDYSKWLVVYGFTNWKQCQSVLAHFESFGTISSRYPSSILEERDVASNWACLRYETALQADKAFCQHGCLLDANCANGTGRLKQHQHDSSSNEVIIVGVMRVDMDIAVRLGLRNHIEFGTSGVQKENYVPPTAGVSSKTEITQRKVLLGENDVLFSKNNDANNTASDISNGAPNGLLEYLFTWMFSW